jgi:hypothetical protein
MGQGPNPHSPIPNPQIPNPQSPIPKNKYLNMKEKYEILKNNYKNKIGRF